MMNNEKERLHRDCEPHTAADCDINTHKGLDPALDDCGHTVDVGPGKDKPKYSGTNATIEVGTAKPDSAC